MAIVSAMANTNEKSAREKATDAFRAMLTFLDFLVTGTVPAEVDAVTIAGLQAAYATNQQSHNPANLRYLRVLHEVVKDGEKGVMQPDPRIVAIEALTAIEVDPPCRFTANQIVRLSLFVARMMNAGVVFTDEQIDGLLCGPAADMDAALQGVNGYTECRAYLDRIVQQHLADHGSRAAEVNRERWTSEGLNGGEYLESATDRENYLLNEHERLTAMVKGEVYP